MNYLLDTHILIWWLINPEKLDRNIIEIISENTIFVSDVSIWEISMKRKKGNLHIEFDVDEMLSENEFQLLPISTDHILETENLAYIHGDPFDRLLIAQALREGLCLITKDRRIMEYPVSVLRV